MRSSNSSSSYNIPISVSGNDINSASRLDDSNSLFNFPSSPHMHHSDYESVYLQFYDLFYPQQASNTADTIPLDLELTKIADSEENASNAVAINLTEQATTEKKCSKKDRHSKIDTMRGPRDRRMRLSLDVARKFFNLQDLLGFDKPSRTVDWLLKNSKAAITELEGGQGLEQLAGTNSASSNSQYEEVMSSGLDDLSGPCKNLPTIVIPKGTAEEPLSSKKKKVKKIKVVRATVASESRRKARERARERTSQKRRLSETENTDKSKLCAEEWIVRATDEIVTNSLSCEVPCHPSSVLNCEDAKDGIQNPHFLAEFKCSGKTWEAYDSPTLS